MSSPHAESLLHTNPAGSNLPSILKERIRWTDPLPNLPLPEVEVSGVCLFVFLHTSTRSAADLFERLTAIVETTTATFERHLETRV